jgi:hypothetical protein
VIHVSFVLLRTVESSLLLGARPDHAGTHQSPTQLPVERLNVGGGGEGNDEKAVHTTLQVLALKVLRLKAARTSSGSLEPHPTAANKAATSDQEMPASSLSIRIVVSVMEMSVIRDDLAPAPEPIDLAPPFQ